MTGLFCINGSISVSGIDETGLLDEVRQLMGRDCLPGSTIFAGIGYKEWIAYLQGECPLELAVAKIQQASRNTPNAS